MSRASPCSADLLALSSITDSFINIDTELDMTKTNATLKTSAKTIERAPLKKTVTATPQRAQRVTANVKRAAQSTKNSLQARFEALMASSNALLEEFEMPTWKRVLCAFVLTITICLGVGYLLGNVLAWLVTGALLVTGSALVGWIVYILGALFAAWTGFKIGKKVSTAVITKDADRSVVSAWRGFKSALAMVNPFADYPAAA